MMIIILKWSWIRHTEVFVSQSYTNTHTHTHIYIHVYCKK
jgi:hypothetical protein